MQYFKWEVICFDKCVNFSASCAGTKHKCSNTHSHTCTIISYSTCIGFQKLYPVILRLSDLARRLTCLDYVCDCASIMGLFLVVLILLFSFFFLRPPDKPKPQQCDHGFKTNYAEMKTEQGHTHSLGRFPRMLVFYLR